ncbi:MAG: hypothetical protein VYA55_19155 [Pseudomonadota bacterium]|nr:hypothetical protein [Pseudomonadota bacterium]
MVNLVKPSVLLFILALLSGCSALDGVAMLNTKGDYQQVVRTSTNVKINQRFDSEYRVTNALDSVFGTGTNTFARYYYQLESAPSDRYRDFSVTFYYQCSYGERIDVVHFDTMAIGKEKRGSRLPSEKCKHRPHRYEFEISNIPYNSSHTDASGVTRVGIYRKGVFRAGIIRRPNGETEFVKFDTKGRANGPWRRIDPSGKMFSGTTKNGEFDGDLYIYTQNGEVFFNHYDNGTRDTEEYVDEASEAFVQDIFDREVKLETQAIDQKINQLQNAIQQQKNIIASKEVQEIRKTMTEHWGGNDCNSIGLYLVREDPNMSADEREYWRGVRKQKDQAKRQICEIMNKIGYSLPNSVNASYRDPIKALIDSTDLSQLGISETSTLMKAIKAYQELDKLTPKIKNLEAERRNSERDLARQQQARKEALLAESRHELIQKKISKATQKKREFDAMNKCFAYVGWGTYETWKVIPEGHMCQGPAGWIKFL